VKDRVSQFDDVGEFHAKFNLPIETQAVAPALPGPIIDEDRTLLLIARSHLVAARDALRESQNVELYRAAFGIEEKVELVEAIIDRDLSAIADALVDGVYVDLGTAHFYAIPFDEVWDEVQRANMTKERGPTQARGHALDVRKPPGWNPPNVAGVLRGAGWDGGR
jgi:hypothetical protein